MITVELHFPFTGATLPSDQGYALYGAISRLIPEAHWLSLETCSTPDGIKGPLTETHEADWLGLETCSTPDGITDTKEKLSLYCTSSITVLNA